MFGTPDVYFYTLQRFCRKFFQSYFNTAQRAVVEVLDAQISIFLEFLSIWAPLQSEIYETYMELQYHANLTTSFFCYADLW